jgi:hypothetical protein
MNRSMATLSTTFAIWVAFCGGCQPRAATQPPSSERAAAGTSVHASPAQQTPQTLAALPKSMEPAVASPKSAAPVEATMLPTEGMWLFNALPIQRLKALGFEPTPEWAENLRLASVHVGGASGAFVSADGLVLTNHHVASGGLQNISRPGKDYLRDGFLARNASEEIPLPGMELRVLESIEDVTARVKSAVDPSLQGEQAVKARNAAFAAISRQSQEKTGLQSDVVTLYGGAVYDLYRYKRYTDVRIVFAPEKAIAFFGGDPDNFEYPRYDLDITLLRVYENGKPAHIDHYLRISPSGVSEGELVFVSGHPGRTDRLLPVAVLEGMRDLTVPLRLQSLERQERVLLAYAARNTEAERQAQQNIFGVQNSLKAYRPRLAALRGDLIPRKRDEERAMRRALGARPDLRHFEDAYQRVASAEAGLRKVFLPMDMIEGGDAFQSVLFRYARELVRLAAEDAKPDDQRLPEYTESRRKPLEHRLFADEPVYPEMEIARLAESLRFFQDKMGPSDPMVAKVLNGKSPDERARQLMEGSKLASAAERKRVRDEGAAAIDTSNDAMIELAKSIDPDAREARRAYESQVEEPLTQSLTELNQARFALFGSDLYPDATGTLRLAFGLVKGYPQDGQQIPPWTTLGGAFEHEQQHGSKPPFELPASWNHARDQLRLQTPLNFVSTADITGGNSGSPVVNRNAELVGIIFDSNRQGVASNFAYSDKQDRAVSVDSRSILEALKKVYGAEALLDELRGDHAATAP